MDYKKIMIAAPRSGSGKTLITCALISAIKSRGISVSSVKCGPDYIDAMFHKSILGIRSGNLDTFFLSEEEKVRSQMSDIVGDREFCVTEGVMGLFDGIGGVRSEGSSYDLARVTHSPIILVLDMKGTSRSIIPVIKGFLDYDKYSLIKGVILNRISKRFYDKMLPLLEEEISVPILGYMENDKRFEFESRNLGLIPPEEITGIVNTLEYAGKTINETVNIEKILEIADNFGSNGELTTRLSEKAGEKSNQSLRGYNPDEKVLAVAKDSAFCFFYDANLNLFKKHGVRLEFFSPIKDTALPKNATGIMLGGGYPENFAEELSQNHAMLNEVFSAIDGGLPSIAEAGGFMYLHNKLKSQNGKTFKLAGVLPGTVSSAGRIVRFGYCNIKEKTPHFLSKDAIIKGHEFHYYDSTDNGDSCVIEKPFSDVKWDGIIVGENYWWGFPQLFYLSAPEFVENFVKML